MIRGESIVAVLQQIGQSPEEIRMPDSSRVLILPYGGRILGLYMPESEENCFWTHPDLNSVQTASTFYKGDNWPNSGGDRTWLAPEAELFISDLQHPWATYRVPSALDPGKYVLKKETAGLQLVNRLTIKQLHSGRSAEVQITKSITPAPNPMRHDPSLCQGVAYAGYTLHTSLNIISKAEEPCMAVGLWNLLQLPHGGELFVATYGRTEPIVQLGQIDSTNITVRYGLLRYRMFEKGIQKIGLRAPVVTGRAAYLHPLNQKTQTLVIRNFQANPSGKYIDAPWDNLNENGYCFQACNVADTDLGRFSELEHHVPAIGFGTDHDSCADVSQIWAFRGFHGTIEKIIECLLGAIGEK